MSKKTLYAFIVSFVLLISVIALNRYSFNRMKSFTELVDHTREVITTFESLANDFKSAQLYSPTLDTGRLHGLYASYKKDADSIDGELQYLRQLVHDNPPQARLVNKIDYIVHSQLPTLLQNDGLELILKTQTWRLVEIRSVHQSIEEGIGHEKDLLQTRKAELESAMHIVNLVTTAFGVIGVGIVLLTFLSIIFLTRRRRWLEGFLESVLNTSQNGIVHYKAIKKDGKIADFRLEFINKAIDQLLEIKSADLIGKKLSEVSSYVLTSDLFGKYVDVVTTGQPMTFETLYARGSVERWFLVSLAKLKDGVTATFHDITQLKKYENELKENITDLERSNTELEQYAYIASHDLQEPLRKIRSFGTYLQDTQAQRLDEKGREQLGKIISSAHRMSTLIKDILGFSSLRREDALEQVDLNNTLQSVLQDLELMVAQKKVVVQNDALPVVEAIPLQMSQLFYNLINNSLKFLKEHGEPLIRITCRRLPESEYPAGLTKGLSYYEMIFTDNGIGFSPEYAEQIFGLFKRLNDKQFYPGSGIGLALCKKVVDNHHGLIIARSQEQQGASFYVYLPEKQPV
jgi:signal transduction histidine kinase